jgi:glycosyltransferase involved in cell wall biosynthesis
LDELLRDPARRAALGAAGRQLAVESYSWEKFTEMTEHIYQQAEVRAGTRR